MEHPIRIEIHGPAVAKEPLDDRIFGAHGAIVIAARVEEDGIAITSRATYPPALAPVLHQALSGLVGQLEAQAREVVRSAMLARESTADQPFSGT
jgi:hypothetical protein